MCYHTRLAFQNCLKYGPYAYNIKLLSLEILEYASAILGSAISGTKLETPLLFQPTKLTAIHVRSPVVNTPVA